jgi:hypothetical protein
MTITRQLWLILDRGQALFMGFFGGAGIGAAGGTVTGIASGPSKVMDKAKKYVKEQHEKAQLEQFYKERYGENEPGTVYTEPEVWLEAQLESMINPANTKEAVYIDPDSFNQLAQLMKNKPDLEQRLTNAGVTQHLAGDKQASKSMGMLLSTNPELSTKVSRTNR